MAEKPVTRTTPREIYKKKGRKKIASLTAYDVPFASVLDRAGIDLILVGDSLGMVLLGYDSTLPVTMNDMIHHTAAVARGVKSALVAADMPYRSYDTPAKAVMNAKLLMKAGAQAVKLEGGAEVAKQIKALVAQKIPVIGHLGMTPQSVKKLGGYRVQGRDEKQAVKILKDAILLDALGVFALVLECVPRALGKEITETVQCPTIGIGAGPDTDGQILVLHDMLGFEGKVHPRFVRKYASVEEAALYAAEQYKNDVQRGRFPNEKESY